MDSQSSVRHGQSLANYAFDLAQSKGRRDPDPLSGLLEVSDAFQDDLLTMRCADRLWRRLKGKTQVHASSTKRPETASRLDHTGTVEDLADRIAEFLGLNRSLSRAIARLHDCGYPPGGRPGADLLSSLSGRKFRHAQFAPVVAQEVLGLNLSFEVLHGVTYHSSGSRPLAFRRDLPLEYGVVMAADTIAFTVVDNPCDAVAEGSISQDGFPGCFYRLGNTAEERVQRCIVALAIESAEMTRRTSKPQISFCKSEVATDFSAFNRWMYEHVYVPLNDRPERLIIASQMEAVYAMLCSSPVFRSLNQAVLLALMTDHEVETLATEFCNGNGIPKIALRSLDQLPPLGFRDFVPMIDGKKKIGFKADLSWANEHRQGRPGRS